MQLLFWKNLLAFLVGKLGFTLNQYNKCVANKMINGKQCNICWHVDDLKMSHMEQALLEDLICLINEKYRSEEAPVTVQCGKIHDYLSMTLNFLTPGKVVFQTEDYIENLLEVVPEDFDGVAPMLSGKKLFEISDKSDKLDDNKLEKFHHLTYKLLYLSKRVCMDIQTTIAFLCTCMTQPNTDNWKKLKHCIACL